MVKEMNITNFTDEEIEILRTILLERSTFYTRKIVEYKTLKLKAENEIFSDSFQESIDFNFKYKNVIDKFYKVLKEKR